MNPIVVKIVKYKCGFCGIQYDELEEADKCCVEIIENRDEIVKKVIKKYTRKLNWIVGQPFYRREWEQMMLEYNERCNKIVKLRMDFCKELRTFKFEYTIHIEGYMAKEFMDKTFTHITAWHKSLYRKMWTDLNTKEQKNKNNLTNDVKYVIM